MNKATFINMDKSQKHNERIKQVVKQIHYAMLEVLKSPSGLMIH